MSPVARRKGAPVGHKKGGSLAGTIKAAQLPLLARIKSLEAQLAVANNRYAAICDCCEGEGHVREEHQIGAPGTGGDRVCPGCEGSGAIIVQRRTP